MHRVLGHIFRRNNCDLNQVHEVLCFATIMICSTCQIRFIYLRQMLRSKSLHPIRRTCFLEILNYNHRTKVISNLTNWFSLDFDLYSTFDRFPSFLHHHPVDYQPKTILDLTLQFDVNTFILTNSVINSFTAINCVIYFAASRCRKFPSNDSCSIV